MIKITVINQMDSSVGEYEDTIFNKEGFQKLLTRIGYNYNTGTGYWESDDVYVLVEEVEE